MSDVFEAASSCKEVVCSAINRKDNLDAQPGTCLAYYLGMKRFGSAILGCLLLAGLVLAAAPASATTIKFSNASLGTGVGNGGNGTLGVSSITTLDGILTASAYQWNGSAWVDSTLWLRTGTNDNGLGVCSTGESCATGGGDQNELSALVNKEAIVLTLANGYNWDALWLSSLDSGGTGSSENGMYFAGNSGDVATLLGGTGTAFGYPAFPPSTTAVEGSLAFSSSLRSVVFIPGANDKNTGAGFNEDYLVWGADVTSVPEGGTTVALLGCALIGLGALRRKFNA